MSDVLKNFADAYATRDKSIEFSDWLADKLSQEMPDLSSDEISKLSNDIIASIKSYDETLADLDKSVDAGQSKESWLADKLMDTCAEIPCNDAGDRLQAIYDNFDTANAELMEDIADSSGGEIMATEGEVVEWNEYSLKSKALDIGKQAVMSGLGVAASIVKQNRESGETVDVNDVIGQALQEGLDTAKSEVKAVVAGSIKVAAEKGLTKLLPEDTSTETIADMACVAVEGAEALMNVAAGNCTMTEALDKTGRAGVAAACRYGAVALKGAIAGIPYVGPLVVEFAGGLIEHIQSEKFADSVYTVVRETAIATWEGIKQAGRNMWNKLTSAITQKQYS